MVIVRIITAGVQVYMPVGNHRYPVYCKKMKRQHWGTVTCLIDAINKELVTIFVTQEGLDIHSGENRMWFEWRASVFCCFDANTVESVRVLCDVK